MNIPHSKFCVLPWISLEASPIGTVRPCCLAEEEILDNDGNKFKLNTANFGDIQNSDYMCELRSEFLFGTQPDTCRKCWAEEDAGRTSKRMHTLERLKHIDMGQHWTANAKPLMFLDLKLGNICNLKCRICGSWSSSQFAAEDIAQLPREEQKKSQAYTMLKAGAWPRENPSFWNQIDACLNDIRYIEFTGGEPFMIQEHFDMLAGIVDRGIAHQVEIHYNTNGTQFPEQAHDIWRHFKTVEIAFSIDDLGSRFEYQRTNAVWAEVVDNISRFRELRYVMPNIQLQCCSTVNIFNIRYIDQLAQWINMQGFDFVYWNIMHDAWFFSVASLPRTAKQKLAEHLNNADIPEKYQIEIQRIVNFMLNGTDSDGTIMKLKIAELDRRRGQDLAAIEPELAEILGYELKS